MSMPVLFAIAYLAVVNATAFCCFGWDKWQAKRHGWRVSERTLLLLSAVGGSLGALAGIYLFRHKTRHRRFTLGVPFILLVQLLFFIWFHFFRLYNR